MQQPTRSEAASTSEACFDVLTTTTVELCHRLKEGSINSVQIVETYLAQIARHNTVGAKCHAVISTTPRALIIASELDTERAKGHVRGPLHGIPILLKDVFATDLSLGMATTAGSCALLDSSPSGSADIVDNLMKRGIIVLGKANMTELSGMKGTSGWSAVGGMCQPAYIPTGYKIGEMGRGETTPAGSSTGSAVGVASGFSSIALGSETSGSLVSPAAVAALYVLKLTPGSVSMRGVFSLTASFDTIGAMGKSAMDVALIGDAMLGKSSLATTARSIKVQDISVGFVDIEKWRLPAHTQPQDPNYFQQTAREYASAKELLSRHGAKVVDVHIIPPEQYMIGDINVDDAMDVVIGNQSKNGCDRYLQDLKISSVRSLEDIVAFNDSHPDKEFDIDYCPDQDRLRQKVAESKPDTENEELAEHCRRWAATEGVDKAVAEHGVDVVVCCSDSYFAGVSVGARYPMAGVPFGYIESSGRPYGLQFVARANEEAKLVNFMAAWESISLARRVPDLLACEKARTHL